MPATTIDEVIESLEAIIIKSKKDQNPMGYFAALYCKVTKKVKEGIAQGVFEDGERMERLDVLFANRYIDAYNRYEQNKKPTTSWELTFESSKKYRLIVLQHLLLGMNAHINLDLAIAAAQTCPGDKIHSLENDFNKINEILGSLVRSVESDLYQIWPLFKYVLRVAGNADAFFVGFSMKLARKGAWKFAKQIAGQDADQQMESIINRDASVTHKAKLVTNPGLIPRFVFFIIRRAERGSVADKIEILR